MVIQHEKKKIEQRNWMFVFVYSSPHLKLSFPHLVVILTTLEKSKSIFCFNNNGMNDNSKQLRPSGARTLRATLLSYLHISKNNNRALWTMMHPSNHPKKYLPNFPTQKNPGIDNFKPKKILWSSLTLEIWSTPPGDRQ